MNRKLRTLLLTSLFAFTTSITPTYALPGDEDNSEKIAEILASMKTSFTTGSVFGQYLWVDATISVDLPDLLPDPVVLELEDKEQQTITVLSTAEGNQLPITLQAVDGGSMFYAAALGESIRLTKQDDQPVVRTIGPQFESLDTTPPDSSDNQRPTCTFFSGIWGVEPQATAQENRDISRWGLLRLASAYELLGMISQATEQLDYLRQRGISFSYRVEQDGQDLYVSLQASSDQVLMTDRETRNAIWFVVDTLRNKGVGLSYTLDDDLAPEAELAGSAYLDLTFSGQWNVEAGMIYDIDVTGHLGLNATTPDGTSVGQLAVDFFGEALSREVLQQ